MITLELEDEEAELLFSAINIYELMVYGINKSDTPKEVMESVKEKLAYQGVHQ
jgi:hypothetical protein